MTIERRSDRAAVKIWGPDARDFLNDLVTAKIDPLEPDARWWALLSPQGKVQAEGLVGVAEDAFWLDIARAFREPFLKRLRLYKLRADLQIDDLGDTHVVGMSPQAVAGVCHRDVRGAGLGHRVIAPLSASTHWSEPENGGAYLAARLDRGICESGADFAADTYFPHDLGMDLLGGIDFSKGCYVGQEVVSRMQHRGTARKRPVLAHGEGLAPGAEIFVDAKTVGVVLAAQNNRGVAIARIDRIGGQGTAEVAGAPVQLVLPEWASYAFADSSGDTQL